MIFITQTNSLPQKSRSNYINSCSAICLLKQQRLYSPKIYGAHGYTNKENNSRTSILEFAERIKYRMSHNTPWKYSKNEPCRIRILKHIKEPNQMSDRKIPHSSMWESLIKLRSTQNTESLILVSLWWNSNIGCRPQFTFVWPFQHL